MAFLSVPASASLQRSTFNGGICGYRPGSARRSRGRQARCTAAESTAGAPAEASIDSGSETRLKTFLNELHRLGKLRLVATNGAAVMESIATFDSLFYAEVRGNEYGNIVDHKLNVDLHLRLAGVSGARWEIGKGRGNPSYPTYAIRILGDDKETVKLSLFLQWESNPSDVEPERIEAWKSLKDTYAKGGDIAWFE